MVLRADDSVLGPIALEDGRRAWVAVRTEEMEQDEREHSEFVVADMKIDFRGDPGEVFAALLDADPAPAPIALSNIILGWHNVRVAGAPVG